MVGNVGTYERCPVDGCESGFTRVPHPITGDIIDIMCPAHKTRPKRYFVDARGFRVGRDKGKRLFKDHSMRGKWLI